MTIRTLIEKLANEKLDTEVDVAAWRKEKGLDGTEEAYFNLYIEKQNTQKSTRLASVLIPDIGASIRTLIEKLTPSEMDKEIDVAAWRKEKGLDGTEEAYLQAFICKKEGYKNKRLLDLLITEVHSKKTENYKDDKVHDKSYDGFYIPTQEDFENACRKCLKPKIVEMPIDPVLDTMKRDIEKAGHKLHKSWRSITEQNIATWSREGD